MNQTIAAAASTVRKCCGCSRGAGTTSVARVEGRATSAKPTSFNWLTSSSIQGNEDHSGDGSHSEKKGDN